jgi:DNA-binding transcriptional MerR regulator
VSSLRRTDEPEHSLTIEQLAALSGMTVRNIRAHQARGLLAPPEVRMRVGYYGPEHLARLRLIRRLQDDGFNLGGIKRLLDDREGTAERLLAFKQALTTATGGETPEVVTLDELAQRFRVSREEAPAVLERAQAIGALVALSEDLYEVPSPSLLALAEEVVAGGIALPSALSVLEEIERHVDSVSRAFVELFLGEIWKPFAQADMPAERWPEIEAAVERLAPIASEAVMTIFGRRLGDRLEDAFGEIARRVSERAV